VVSLSLRLLRQAVDPRISGFEHSLIKTSASPSTVHRVVLTYPQGHPGVRSVVVKSIAPIWPNDPHGPEREPSFYNQLLPCLDLDYPHVYHVGSEPRNRHRLIVMQDISASHRFPPPAHCWTPDEAEHMVQAYALLHVQGQHCLPPVAERGWMWRMALHEKGWKPEELGGLAQDLVAQGLWAPVAHIEDLIERTLAELAHFARYPPTLLHNDVFPPNVALPFDPDGQAILLDWEMAGWGLAELDLAFMFLQPFRSEQYLDRGRVLASYWAQRRALEGVCPPAEERQATQDHADAMWALSLVPVAHRVAAKPYPTGSAPQVYWKSMFGVLHERLADLCERL
jgi:hypothetical protein